METCKVDAVVVGSGAAFTLAEGGAKAVLLEKYRFIGGASKLGMGVVAVDPARKNEAFNYIMEGVRWRVDVRLVKALIDETASTVEWLKAQEVEFEPPIKRGIGLKMSEKY